MSDFEKNNNTNDTEDNVIKDIQYISSPKGMPSDDDDLEFISEESVKDKSKMAGGVPIRDEFVSEKKTRRRSADEQEAKMERTVAICKQHLPLIIIIVAVIIALIIGLSLGVKAHRSKKEDTNREQPISAQEYEKDEHQEINELITDYYAAYAAGDTESIQLYAYPMTDTEKSYISTYSEFIESYENIVCYTKTGLEEDTYVVSASFDLKFKDAEMTAPGLDFFYVRTNESGSVYIDNIYSPFNLHYQEIALDESIQQFIEEFMTADDVITLQASVQTRYEEALSKDETLKQLLEETVVSAMAEWADNQTIIQQQKAEDAQAEVQKEENANKESTEITETEQKAWVYTTESVNIRKKPKTKSDAVASVVKGSELRQLAVTSNGWSKVKTGDVVGYVKSKYLSTEKPEDTSSDTSSDSSSDSAADSGEQIYLENTVNVRKSMSESAERVGVAYAGDTVTVIMSYAEGWTKVEWNGKTGYVKTELLTGN